MTPKIRVAMLLLFCVILKISVQVTIKFSLSHAVYHSKTFNLSQTSQLNIILSVLSFYRYVVLLSVRFSAFYELRKSRLISYFTQFRMQYDTYFILSSTFNKIIVKRLVITVLN